MTKLKNRYGDEYWFEKIDDETYVILGELNHWRFGGKEGIEGVNMEDLGFVDPSGGPYIAIGMTIEGKIVKRILVDDGKILFKV